MTSSRRSGASELVALSRAAIGDADPEARVRDACADLAGEWTVIALGKAAVSMARGAWSALDDGARVTGGLAVAPVAADCPLSVVVGDHPQPTGRSVAAARALIDAVSAAPGSILALVSGGGSALATLPAPGLSLDETVSATAMLMRAGAPIDELNQMRTALSDIKGGRLGARCTHVLTLAVSDVIGDDPAVIASGPTVPPHPTSRPRSICRARGIWNRLPKSVQERLAAAEDGELPEVRVRGEHRVIAPFDTVARAAVSRLGGEGRASLESTPLSGPVTDVADIILARAGALDPGRAWVSAAEATIVIPEHAGQGGRAQQLALMLCGAIAGTDLTVVVMGSDGIDGNSPAAGAVIDGTTRGELERAGIDVASALARCDAHPALDAVGACIVTGATGVNHADLIVVRRATTPC